LSGDFDKSDFDKSTPATKSQEQMFSELWEQILLQSVIGWPPESDQKEHLSKLRTITGCPKSEQYFGREARDKPIGDAVHKYVENFLAGNLRFLHRQINLIRELGMSRDFLGAKDAAWACRRIHNGMLAILYEVGADARYVKEW